MKLWAFVFIALSQQCFGGDVSGSFADAAARGDGVEAVLLRRVSSVQRPRAQRAARLGWLVQVVSCGFFTGKAVRYSCAGDGALQKTLSYRCEHCAKCSKGRPQSAK